MYQKLREWKGQIDKFTIQKIVISFSKMLIEQSKKKKHVRLQQNYPPT